MSLDNILQGDVLKNIDADDSCIQLAQPTCTELGRNIAGMANTNGGIIVVGMSKGRVVGVDQKEFEKEFENIKLELSNVEPTLVFRCVRISEPSAFIEIAPSSSLASYNGVIYTLEDNKPIAMPKKNILQKLGIGLDSDLFNIMARQVADQSKKIDSLQNSLENASSWKYKLKDWISGGIVGLLLSWIFKLITQ